MMAQEMKDSGVEWIGKVPASWTISRIKNECINLDYLREPISAERRDNRLGLYDYYGASGVIDKMDRYNVDDTVLLIGEDGANLRMRNLPLVYRATGKFWVNNHAHILKVKPYNDYSYMAYLLEAGDYTVSITGSAQPKLSQFNLMNFPIVMPPINEQKAISKRLDDKCSEIDTILSKTRTSIEEYKKLKQSIITQAVTKGIQKDMPMKESGIEWLGEIPLTWTLSKIGNLYAQRNEKVSDKDFAPLSVTMKGIVPQLETAAKTDDGDNRKLIRKGDFAINSRSDRRGSCGISAYDGSVSLINIILTPRGKMHPGYFEWLFHTSLFADEFYKWGHGIVDDLWTTRWQEMKAICVPVPPYRDQECIASFLNKKCTDLDKLIAKKIRITNALESYKKSLIYEYVTGKKEIP